MRNYIMRIMRTKTCSQGQLTGYLTLRQVVYAFLCVRYPTDACTFHFRVILFIPHNRKENSESSNFSLVVLENVSNRCTTLYSPITAKEIVNQAILAWSF